MRDAMFPGETYILSYVAMDEGFFDKHGIDMDFIFPDSGAAANKLLLAGQLDVYSTLPLGLAAKSAETDPGSVKIVGSQRSVNAFNLLVPEADAPEKPLDLAAAIDQVAGRTIGVTSEGSGTDLVISLALHELGRPLTDIRRLGVGTTLAALGQLQNGTIDGYMEFTRAGTSLIEKELPAVTLFPFSSTDAPLAVQAQADVAMTANADFAEENPEAIERWLAALDEAREWMLQPENLDRTAEIGAKYLYEGDNVDLVKTALEGLLNEYRQNDWGSFKYSKERYQASITGLTQIGYLQGSDAVKYEILVAATAHAP